MIRISSVRCAVASALLLLAVADGSAAEDTDCRPPLERWTEVGLYLGRDIAGVGEVTEAQFRRSLAREVTPRFPDGLSVLDVQGQFRDGKRIVRERSKLLVILVPDAREAEADVAAFVGAYKDAFRQQSVLRTETPVCLSFD